MGGFTLRIIYENGSFNWSLLTTDISLSNIENWVNAIVIEGITDYDACLKL